MHFEDEVLRKIKSIEVRFYVTFLSALMCGVLAHLYQFTNKNFNYDELGQTPAGFGAGVALGRWGLQLVGDFVGHFFRNYSLPMINGMFTLLFVALSACVVVKVFCIHNTVNCFLIGGIFSVIPSLVSTFFFMFTAPYYGFSLFLACMAGLYIIEGFGSSKIDKSGVIKVLVGILLLTLSLGIYQAYSAVVLCILLIDIIIGFYEQSEEWTVLLRRGICYCVTFCISLGVYLVLSKVAVAITGIQLDGYRGIDELGTVNLGGLLYSFIKVYIDYIFIMTPKDVYQINPVRIVCVLLIVINLVNVFFVVKRLKKKEKIISKIGFIVTVALLPVAIYFPEVLVQGNGGVYAIMTYATVFIFVFPLVLYEKSDGYKDEIVVKRDWIGRILGITVTCSIMIYIWFANGNYQALQYTTYHDLAYFETLATQVKSLDGYRSDMKVALVGKGFKDPTFSAGGLMDEYFDINGKWSTNVNYFNNIYLWTSYLGYTPEIIELADSGELSEIPEVKEMPCYPDSGSIAIVDDIVIIKTSE